MHQYVMPLVDANVPGGVFFIEPFPLYFHLPALKARLGGGFEQWFLRRKWASYEKGLEAQALDDRAGYPPEKPLREIRIEEISEYKDKFLLNDKAVLILHRIHKELGDEIFLKAVSGFIADHRTKPAALDGFEATISQASGRSYQAFFRRWFDTTDPLPDEWR